MNHTESPVHDEGEPLRWSELESETATRLEARLPASQARREARWLVEEASGAEGSDFESVSDDAATLRCVASLDRMVSARLEGRPIQYVLGHWAFRTLDLMVDQRVLIPRPETEVVAGVAMDLLGPVDPGHLGRRAVDLGTGSGAVGLSLAAERPDLHVVLSDVDEAALAVARANLAGLGRAGVRVEVRHGAWFDALDPVSKGEIELLVSNPPYIADHETLDADVLDWEPAGALFAGPAGTEHLEHLISGAGEWLSPGGAIVLEMASNQTEWAAHTLGAMGFVEVSVFDDLAGRSRGVSARRGPAGGDPGVS